MTFRRGGQIATASLPIHAPGASESAEIELVVLYTGPETTGAVLERAVHLTAGLNATVALVAVCTVPYQSPFGCPLAVRSHLVKRLTELANGCKLPVRAHLVLAPSRNHGFRCFLPPRSPVLIGARRRPWRTPEEKLAGELADNGHRVALFRFDSRELG
jgi:hypothetical protein